MKEKIVIGQKKKFNLTYFTLSYDDIDLIMLKHKHPLDWLFFDSY